MTQTIAVVQARMGSQRLPGKMLEVLGERTIIDWVLTRVQRSSSITSVILATTTNELDDALVAEATRLGVEIFRGDEFDVLGRFESAIRGTEAAAVVRVCADNPFIDPNEVDRLVEHFWRCEADYAFNHRPYGDSQYADGFGAEIIKTNLLMEAARKISDQTLREHVTAFVWESESQLRITGVPARSEVAYPNLRFDVDSPNDLEYLRSLVAMGVNMNSAANQIIELSKMYETGNTSQF